MLLDRFAPRLRDRDLTGAARVVPDDLPADPTLVVFGFSEPHQADIDRWAAALPNIPFVEAVLIPRLWEWRRAWIEGGMAAYLRDPVVRARSWCLYADVDATLQALGVQGQEEVVAAVIRPSGGISALVRGAPDATSAATIEAALDEPLPAAAA